MKLIARIEGVSPKEIMELETPMEYGTGLRSKEEVLKVFKPENQHYVTEKITHLAISHGRYGDAQAFPAYWVEDENRWTVVTRHPGYLPVLTIPGCLGLEKLIDLLEEGGIK